VYIILFVGLINLDVRLTDFGPLESRQFVNFTITMLEHLTNGYSIVTQ